MGDIIDFSEKEYEIIERLEFEIPKTKEFLDYTKKLSDFVKDLPLNKSQNDTLISMILNCLCIAREDAFRYGVDTGIQLSEEIENKKDFKIFFNKD